MQASGPRTERIKGCHGRDSCLSCASILVKNIVTILELIIDLAELN